jgi:hypothetical protein
MKAFSLPAFSSLGTAALAYPFLCQPQLKIAGNDEMIMFAPCLIDNIEINYAPQGLPAFFEGTHLPAFIEVSISMIETEMQTADRYGRTGGDRLEEMWDKLTETLQKGLDAAGAGFDLNDGLKDLNDSIVKGLSSSSSAETPARTGT